MVENMSHFISGRKYVHFFIGRKSVRQKSVRRKNVRRKNVPVPFLVVSILIVDGLTGVFPTSDVASNFFYFLSGFPDFLQSIFLLRRHRFRIDLLAG